MIELSTVAVFVFGVALLFAGATISRYAIASVGALLGAGGGYLLAPTAGSALGTGSGIGTVLGIVVGIAMGVVVTYLLFSFAVAAVSFVVGSFVGLAGLLPLVLEEAWYVEIAAAIAIGMLAAMVALVLTKTTTIVLTAFVGAALTTGALRPTDFEAARAATTVDPLLFDVTNPILLALCALGILTQFGLFRFGYVTRIAALVPGANGFRKRSKKGQTGS